MPEPRSLLLVEDEPLVASLLCEALSHAGFDVRVAHNAIDGAELAREFQPEVAVLDINLGAGGSGVDLAFILRRQHPDIALALLTKHPDLRTAGFDEDEVPPGCGFIRKDMITDTSAVVQAIEDVLGAGSRVRQDANPERPFGSLTTTQVEVLRLVAQGFTNAEIAKRRGTSPRTVERLISTVFDALDIEVDGPLNPRIEAVRMFIRVTGTPERS